MWKGRGMSRVAIVTGGTRGIGEAICRRLQEQGLTVVANYGGNEAKAKQFTDETGIRSYRWDVGDHQAALEGCARVEAEVGPIDVLVNNAGWDVFKPFTKTEPTQWAKLIAINLTGALHMHHAVLPGMAARKKGRIVNISSDAARVGSSGEAVYAACKGGLVAFSKTIAREHARHGITVNVVCPGPTDTALFADYKEGAGNPEKLMEAFTRSIPLGRIGQPDDLPGAIAFFASDDAAYITGQVISVSGGLTMNG
jgi:2-hydroxycyclohexanecarboxyl-CoA dehydrogenase